MRAPEGPSCCWDASCIDTAREGAWESTIIRSATASGRTDPDVAYLLGLPRSGTTLLSLALEQHPSIACPPEPWVMLALQSFGAVPMEHPGQAALVNYATAEFLGADRIDILGQCARTIYREHLRRHAKEVFVDKTPRYYHCLDFIHACLPEAKYVWIRRNPLDVAASYKTTWGVDLVALTRAPFDDPFLFDFALGPRWLADFAGANVVCSLTYEDLVSDPRAEMHRVFRHLEVPALDIDTRIDASSSSHGRSSFGDRKIIATREIHGNSVDTWRDVLSADEVAAVLSGLGRDLFARLGYGNQFDVAAARLSRSIDDRSSELEAASRRFLHERSEYTKLERAKLDRQAKDRLVRSLSERVEALETDRTLKDEVIGRLTNELESIENDRRQKDEVVGRLATQMEAIENDRRLKNELIDRLGSELRTVEADRQAKDALIRAVSERIEAVESDRAAKDEVIGRLSNQVKQIDNDRRLKDELIDRVAGELRTIEADRQAKDGLIGQLSEQLQMEQRVLAEKEETSRGLAANLSAAQAEIRRLNERPLARLSRFMRSRLYAR